MEQVFIKHIPVKDLENIANLIDFSTNKAVSKTLSENEALRITLFAIDENVHHPFDSNTNESTVQLLQGSLDVEINTPHTISIQPGKTILIPPGIPFKIITAKPSKLLFVQIINSDIIGFDTDNDDLIIPPPLLNT